MATPAAQVQDSLQAWAKERTAERDPAAAESEELPEGEVAEGEDDEPEWADEMETFFAELEADYPDLSAKLAALIAAYEGEAVEASEGGDLAEGAEAGEGDVMGGGVEVALDDLLAFMASEPMYPELDEGERENAGERIDYHYGHLDRHPGGGAQATAIGLREAAPEKYEQFRASREA